MTLRTYYFARIHVNKNYNGTGSCESISKPKDSITRGPAGTGIFWFERLEGAEAMLRAAAADSELYDELRREPAKKQVVDLLNYQESDG